MTLLDDAGDLGRHLTGTDESAERITLDALGQAIDMMYPIAEVHQGDPTQWVRDRLRYELWSRQREIIEAVRDHRQVAVHSAHAIGKSLCGAATALWWIDTHPIGDAFVITTAPTHNQVAAILWREMNRLHARGGLGGRMNLLEWYFGNELVAMGRKPADYDPDAFQGIHSRYVLVLFDEACHDDQTDVMTDRGWRRFADLDGTEKLLTMDPVTHEAHYMRPQRVVRRPYTGEMIQYGGERGEKGANYCVTPDHQMFYAMKNRDRVDVWRRRRADEMKQGSMRRDINWIAPDVDKHVIPGCVTVGRHYDTSWPELRVSMDDWLELLGWWCAEGHIGMRRERARSAVITQKKDSRVLDRIEQLCTQMGIGPVSRNQSCVFIRNAAVAREFMRCGRYQHERRIPNYVRYVSARQIKIFLDTYARGDGTRRGDGWVILTSSRGMSDDLHELVLKVGRTSKCGLRYRAGEGRSVTSDGRVIINKHDAWYVTYPSVSTQLKYYPHKARRVAYDGWVYCATVAPDHLLLTRRGGFSLWSGNCGMSKQLWDAASTLTANEDSRFLAIGNPDDPHGEFARVCRPSSGWNVIHVSAYDTPNFTDEPVSEHVAASLVSPTWVEEKKRSWGENSALYASKVRGEFPSDSDAGVVPHSWAVACRYTQLPAVGIRAAGLDVGGGGDRTVLRERVGPRAGREASWIESDPMVVCGEIVHKLTEWGTERVVVDVIGIGWGLAGRLKELSRRMNHGRISAHDAEVVGIHDAEVVYFNAAGASTQPDRFINRRAELHWSVGRERSRLRTWDLEEVDDDTLRELTEAEYVIMDSRGKIKIEPKERVIERLGRSPDRADALLMAFWEGDSVDVHLPAGARVLTGAFYDEHYELTGPTWAGPRRSATSSTEDEQREVEVALMRELTLGRPT